MSTSPTIKVARVSDGEIVVICEKYFDPHFYVRLEDKDSIAPSESATAKAEAKAKADAEAEALKASEEAKAKADAEAEAVKAEAAEAAKAAEALKAEAEAVTAEAEAAKATADAAVAEQPVEPAPVETGTVDNAPVETAAVEPVAETVEEANLAIRNAVMGLDSNDASLWTVMGLPTTAAVAAVLGRDITRKEIELAAGDLVRAAATAGNGTGTE